MLVIEEQYLTVVKSSVPSPPSPPTPHTHTDVGLKTVQLQRVRAQVKLGNDGRRDSTSIKTLALYAADTGSISELQCPLSTAGSDLQELREE